jgi:hypothetical protein
MGSSELSSGELELVTQVQPFWNIAGEAGQVWDLQVT